MDTMDENNNLIGVGFDNEEPMIPNSNNMLN